MAEAEAGAEAEPEPELVPLPLLSGGEERGSEEGEEVDKGSIIIIDKGSMPSRPEILFEVSGGGEGGLIDIEERGSERGSGLLELELELELELVEDELLFLLSLLEFVGRALPAVESTERPASRLCLSSERERRGCSYLAEAEATAEEEEFLLIRSVNFFIFCCCF